MSIIEKYGDNAFDFADDHILVTLPFDETVLNNQTEIYFDKNDKLSNKLSDKLSNKSDDEWEINIYDLIEEIKQNPYDSISKLAIKFNVKDRIMRYNIQKLKEKGIVRRVGSRKTGKWIIDVYR